MKKQQQSTALLLALIALSLALLGFRLYLSYGMQAGTLGLSDEPESSVLLSRTIKPMGVVVGFGDPVYHRVLRGQDTYYEQAGALLQSALIFTKKAQPVEAQQVQSVQKAKSVSLQLRPISGKLLSRSFFLEHSPIDVLAQIDEIVIPLVDERNLYLRSQNQYYRIENGVLNTMPAVDELSKTDYIKYTPLGSFFPGVKSDVLFPSIERQDFVLTAKTFPTTAALQPLALDQAAARAFGKRYDFTTRMRNPDGSAYYTYNYGQEVLRFDSTGHVSYVNDAPATGSIEEEEAYRKAAMFLDALNFDLNQLALSSCKPDENKGVRGYRLTFLQMSEDLPVMPKNSEEGIVVRVIGRDVYSVKGLRRFTLPFDPAKPYYLMSPLAALESQFRAYLQERFQVDAAGLFQSLQGVELVYLYSAQYQLFPAWKFTIAQQPVYVNAVTGELIEDGWGKS